MTTFIRTDSTNQDFQNLVALLDKDLAIRDGSDHSFYAQFNKTDSIRNAIVCYNGKSPIACGAFKEFDKETVEIKRMFTLPAFRGIGIGINVLDQLELWAKDLDYTACVLETGRKQPEAIRLYEKAGYAFIANYGQYIGIENSVCMKKQIR